MTLAGTQQGPRYGAASLTRANGFTGADGQVRLQPDGTPLRAFAILEVQGFGATTIDAASNGGTAAVQTPAPATQLN